MTERAAHWILRPEGGLRPFAGVVGLLAQPVKAAVSDAATFCLVAATAALGMKSSVRQIFSEGWRPVAAMAAQTVLLAIYALGCITLFRL